MSDRPYSRLYHELAEEYPDVYDGPLLADYMRLLVSADQAYPVRARWAGITSRRALQSLAARGLIVVDGARYSVKGMDKERASRSAKASAAATARHTRSNAQSSASSSATGNAGGTAQSMPRRDKPSRDETSRVETSRDSGYLGPTGPDSAGVFPVAAGSRR